MANLNDEPRTGPDEPEEEEGGPIKSFLEHLEDLRWVLIKSLAVLGIAVVACLLGGPVVVKVLMWPLERARSSTSAYVEELTKPLTSRLADSPLGHWSATAWLFTSHRKLPEDQRISIYFATNRLGTFELSKDQRARSPFGTNHLVALELEPVPNAATGGWLLGLRAITNSVQEQAGDRLNIQIINLSPAGGFIVAFHIALYAGLVIAAPFIIYFLATYIFPALKMREKHYAYSGMAWGIGLFMTGVSFCYFGLMPVALTASVQYSNWLGFSAPQWRAEDYVSFVSKFLLGMGVGFELPVVILILVKIGVLNHRMLAAARRYVIVINFTLGAILTTPEVITQVLMALPLQLLYELTVWIAWYWERRDKKRAAAREAAGES
jgi:sec-independent protein translocase protein TatC